jgi:hypothetical protein
VFLFTLSCASGRSMKPRSGTVRAKFPSGCGWNWATDPYPTTLRGSFPVSATIQSSAQPVGRLLSSFIILILIIIIIIMQLPHRTRQLISPAVTDHTAASPRPAPPRQISSAHGSGLVTGGEVELDVSRSAGWARIRRPPPEITVIIITIIIIIIIIIILILKQWHHHHHHHHHLAPVEKSNSTYPRSISNRGLGPNPKAASFSSSSASSRSARRASSSASARAAAS